jgi:hypothetical protein
MVREKDDEALELIYTICEENRYETHSVVLFLLPWYQKSR